jgi:glycosyltransferase involved in cell wall biosynthesis
MIKVCIENNSSTTIGGGFRFLENFRKGLQGKVEFVDKVEDCDIFFMFSISAVEKGNIYRAKELGKKIILRCDNIPRKSRNTRCSPVERLAEFGKMADWVVYQSEWCRRYAGYFIQNNSWSIINNGVDTSIFNKENRKSDGKTYLYINFNDNPNKRFDEALYWFDLAWREDNKSHLVIAGNAPRVYLEHPEFNWDLPTKGYVNFIDVQHTPEEVANVMKHCDYLLFPSFAEAYPNTVLEALACGMEIIHFCKEGGTREAINNSIIKVKPIQEMADEYLHIFNSLI